MRSLVLSAAAALLCLPSVGAAQPIRIDFRAFTEDGQQVADLKTEDLALKINGKPRAIQSLSVMRSSATAESALPPPYASNALGRRGRSIYILIDDDSIAPGRETPMKEAVRLLASELAPGDRIGVLTTQGQVNIRPAEDVAKIRLAVDALAGKASPSETEQDAKCRTTHVLAAVGTMLAVSGGTPTTIVVFAGGLSPPEAKIVDIGGSVRTAVGGRAASASATSDVCPVRPEDFQNIAALASTTHADFYLFHLIEGLVNRSSTQDAGFESLAGVTGAEFVRLSGSPQAAVARLLRETSSYYVATFEPEPSERNGQTLRVDLRAVRDKVTVRTRPAVETPKAAAKGAASPKDMLRTATDYRDLPLRAAAYASRTPGSEDVKIVALFEAIDGTPLTAASVGLFDEKNTLKKQWTAQPADLTKRPSLAALSAPPGTYRVRVAAVDGGNRAGTTDYELRAEVPRADPLKLSALVLGAQQQGSGFVPRLEFTTEPVAIGLVEIYGVPKGGTVSVDLDVASTPDGSPLATAQTQVAPGNSEDMRIAYGGFDVANLQPGDYLMRAVVSLDGKPVGKVVRTLRKSR